VSACSDSPTTAHAVIHYEADCSSKSVPYIRHWRRVVQDPVGADGMPTRSAAPAVVLVQAVVDLPLPTVDDISRVRRHRVRQAPILATGIHPGPVAPILADEQMPCARNSTAAARSILPTHELVHHRILRRARNGIPCLDFIQSSHETRDTPRCPHRPGETHHQEDIAGAPGHKSFLGSSLERRRINRSHGPCGPAVASEIPVLRLAYHVAVVHRGPYVGW
jgi:hypothetical protein